MTRAGACPRSGHALTEATFVCLDCVAAAEADLFDLAQFMRWGDDKRARVRSPMGSGGGGRPREAPLPFDPRVTPALRAAQEVVRRGVVEVRKTCPSSSYPVGEAEHSALWLMSRCAWIAGRPWAVDLFDAIGWAAADVRRLFDNAPDRVYLGRCGAELQQERTCSESLYAELDDKGRAPAIVRCPACDTNHDVRARRGDLAGAVDGYLGTAREIARLLSLTLGDAASEQMVWAYARRGLILARGERMEIDVKGRRRPVSVYRIGEVRRAAERARVEEEERRLRRKLDRSRRAMASLERHADRRKGA